MRLFEAEHRCFPACILRKPVLSVVAGLVNSETSSQVRTRLLLPKTIVKFRGAGNRRNGLKIF